MNDENRWTDTPERAGGSKSAKKMFGSIERGLDRVRLMLTPRRRQLQREMDPLSANNSSGGPNIVSNKVIYFTHSFLIEKPTQGANVRNRKFPHSPYLYYVSLIFLPTNYPNSLKFWLWLAKSSRNGRWFLWLHTLMRTAFTSPVVEWSCLLLLFSSMEKKCDSICNGLLT